MRKLSIILFIVNETMFSYSQKTEIEMVKENKSPSFQPEPLDDDWSKFLVGDWKISGKSEWIVGELEGLGESDIKETGGGHAKIELSLNGQFLIMQSEGEIGEITDIQKQNLEKTTGASEEEIIRFLGSPFKSLQIYTVDPKTGEIIGYLFDSLRSIAEGKGKVENNKEIMEWKWYSLGKGTSSLRIRAKVNDNKLIINEEFTLPDGKIMKERMIMTRITK